MISAHARSSKGEDRWSSSEFVEGWLSDLSLICWIRSMMFLFLFWRLKKKRMEMEMGEEDENGGERVGISIF